jgi:hypothetical protein
VVEKPLLVHLHAQYATPFVGHLCRQRVKEDSLLWLQRLVEETLKPGLAGMSGTVIEQLCFLRIMRGATLTQRDLPGPLEEVPDSKRRRADQGACGGTMSGPLEDANKRQRRDQHQATDRGAGSRAGNASQQADTGAVPVIHPQQVTFPDMASVAYFSGLRGLQARSNQWGSAQPPQLLFPDRDSFRGVNAVALPSTLFKMAISTSEPLSCAQVSQFLDALPECDSYHLFYVVPESSLQEFGYEVAQAEGISPDSRLHRLRVSVVGMPPLSQEEEEARQQAMEGLSLQVITLPASV